MKGAYNTYSKVPEVTLGFWIIKDPRYDAW
jgi:uncharacterized membrane-anchored protein